MTGVAVILEKDIFAKKYGIISEKEMRKYC